MKRRKTIYSLFIKRFLDIVLSLIAIIILSPLLIILFILVRIKLGGPAIFVQKRPGKKGKIFKLYKFRTMTNEKDEFGNLLPDDKRLTKFAKILRSTSLDELPELFNILFGSMSIVGPRPQLVKDLVFMSEEQNFRHEVRQGLTGLAQVSGRNAISWEDKFKYDNKYVEKITFFGDCKIIFKTVINVLKRSDISQDGLDTAEDYGDYLLRQGIITEEKYIECVSESKKILKETE